MHQAEQRITRSPSKARAADGASSMRSAVDQLRQARPPPLGVRSAGHPAHKRTLVPTGEDEIFSIVDREQHRGESAAPGDDIRGTGLELLDHGRDGRRSVPSFRFLPRLTPAPAAA